MSKTITVATLRHPLPIEDEALKGMTKARLKRATANLRYLDRSSVERRWKELHLAMRAAKLKHPIYIIEPHEHGNGGLCGSRVLDVVEKEKLFTIDPVRTYLNNHYCPSWGSMIRACHEPDLNAVVYLWQHDQEVGAQQWLTPYSRPLEGPDGEREKAARLKRELARTRMWNRIKGKLSKAEWVLVTQG